MPQHLLDLSIRIARVEDDQSHALSRRLYDHRQLLFSKEQGLSELMYVMCLRINPEASLALWRLLRSLGIVSW